MKINVAGLKKLREKQALLMKGVYDNRIFLAQDIMTSPTFLYLDDDIDTILGKLQMEDINYCIVVDEKRRFIGEITDEMLLKIIANTSVNEPLCKILDIGYKRGVNYTHTRDYVKKHKNIVYEDTPLFDIMKLIDKRGFQFIPVIDEKKEVIGLITPSSILRFILER